MALGKGNDGAVAPLIGIVIIVAAAVTTSAGLGVALYLDEKPASPIAAGFHADHTEAHLLLRYVKGEPLPTPSAQLWVTAGPNNDRVDLVDHQAELGATWDQSELVCVAGPYANCVTTFLSTQVTGLRVVAQGQTVWDWSHNVTAATGGGTGPPPPAPPTPPPSPPADEDDDEEDNGAAPSGSDDDGPPPAPPAGEPDLTGTIDAATPSAPHAGQATTFTATVQNGGDATTGGPFTVRFFVDDALLSVHSLAALAPGGSLQVISDPWTATGGSHTVEVRIDDPSAVSESDETNNIHQLPVSVATAVLDPGHAYEDVDLDALFTPGVDIAIPDEEVLDGAYTVADPWGLVVPASIGPIAASSIDLRAGVAGHLILGAALTGDTVRLEAGTHVNLTDGPSLTATTGSLTITAGGAVSAPGATLVADTLVHVVAGHDVDLTDATLTAAPDEDPPAASGKKVLICHFPPGNPENRQTIEISTSALHTHEDHHDDHVGPCTNENGILVELTTTGRTVTVDGSSVDDPDDTGLVSGEGALIAGTPTAGAFEVHVPEDV